MLQNNAINTQDQATETKITQQNVSVDKCKCGFVCDACDGSQDQELFNFENSYSGNPDFNYDGEDGCEGIMEIFEPHLSRVVELNKVSPQYVWTVMEENEQGQQLVCAGFCSIAVQHYFISNEPWDEENEEYLWV